MPRCWHCKAETTPEHYARVVYGTGPLYGPWAGWRIAGRFLVAPDGKRLTPERLRGLLWTEEHRRRAEQKTRSGSEAGFSLKQIPPRERFDGQS